MNVGVLGAGAIGCFVGGKLLSSGAHVTLIGRASLQKEIAEHGMTLVALDGKTERLSAEKVRIETDPVALADCDVVLATTKSGGTLASATSVAGVLAKDCLVVSLQNGVRNPETLRSVLSQTVLGGIVGFNVVWKSGAIFHQATRGPLVIEASSHARATELVSRLKEAGFLVETTSNIRGVQWSKLVVNLNNAVGALCDVPTRELIMSPRYRRVLAATIEEALIVLRAAGVRPAKLGPLPVSLFPMLLRLPTPVLRIFARSQLRIDPEARSSMWQDLDQRRDTEIDFLNGEIVRLADASGIQAPKNSRIVELVREAERAKKGSSRIDADVLWNDLEHAKSS